MPRPEQVIDTPRHAAAINSRFFSRVESRTPRSTVRSSQASSRDSTCRPGVRDDEVME